MAALQPNQKWFVDCTNHSQPKSLCGMWIRLKKEKPDHLVYCVDVLFDPHREFFGTGVQTFWLTASSVVRFPARFDVFDLLHLCYLTRLSQHCSGSAMQGCCLSNLCSPHGEIGICMWIAFLLSLMWGTISCRMITWWGKKQFFPPLLSSLSPLRQKQEVEPMLCCCIAAVEIQRTCLSYMLDWESAETPIEPETWLCPFCFPMH